MNAKQTLKELTALGSAQNRKVYARHGVREPLFGVSYANLGKLALQLEGAHDVALELWASGNHDARVLATLIADPRRMSASDLQSWAAALDNYVLTEALAKLAARVPQAQGLMKRWIAARSEWPSAAGWTMLSHRLNAREPFSNTELAGFLSTIEARVHGAPNRTRYAMLGALIGIGTAAPELTSEALAAARRIGPVEVDHGETGCKTPDPAGYIEKILARRGKDKAAPKRTAKQ